MTKHILGATLLIALVAPGLRAEAYGIELSQLAQRYYRLCRAEQRLRDQLSRDFNEKHLPEPPVKSLLDTLPEANRRDAQLVCLGAIQQQFDDDAHVPAPVVVAKPKPVKKSR